MTDVDVAAGADAQLFVDDLRRLVEVETPTADVAACGRGVEVLRELMATRTGRQARVRALGGRAHLHAPARAPRARVLVLGHIDTVWPLGTLARWPMVVAGDHVTGPGVFDMKGGLVMGMHAMAALGDPDDVAWLVTSDEEVGAPTSQAFIEECARAADAVLVLEPSAPGGAVKVARKGVVMSTVELVGRAAHAGLEPELGVNALVALAEVVPQVAALSDVEAGTTVTPTLASAGTTRNTVPATARFAVDIRAQTSAEVDRVRAGLRLLARAGGDGIAAVRVIEDGWRAPLERDMSAPLLPAFRAARAGLGLPPAAEVAVGGGSDGNFTAAVGTPTLDGLGPVGSGAHAEGEHLLLAATRDSTRVLTALITALRTVRGA